MRNKDIKWIGRQFNDEIFFFEDSQTEWQVGKKLSEKTVFCVLAERICFQCKGRSSRITGSLYLSSSSGAVGGDGSDYED